MAELTLRPATEADRAEIEALIDACYAEVYPGWYDEETLEYGLPANLRIDADLLASGRYLVAESEGRILGCGGWSTDQPGTQAVAGGIGNIRHFATRPAVMRQGVGSAILKTCIAAASDAGVKRLQCFSSLAAEAFYALHGFERVKETHILLGGDTPFPAILMELTLA
jgi:N-acetylglutamate synthase-like GNAT family acetyltransferase